MAAFWRVARQIPLTPIMVVGAASSRKSHLCQAQEAEASVPSTSSENEDTRTTKPKFAGMQHDAQGYFHDLFPKRQLFQPKVEWPLWDKNWDGREPEPTGDKDQDRQRTRQIRKEGVTRHIILIRHGQYDEKDREDEKRVLTPVGRQQAHATGLRLAEMLNGIKDDPTSPCNIRIVRVSNMTRAKETADIIASYIPTVERAGPDEMLSEGRPCHNIPGTPKADPIAIEKTDEHHPRIEAAFQKYFYRAPVPQIEDGGASENPGGLQSNSEETSSETDAVVMKHEYEIIVCHANVIRYFLCR